MRKINTGIKLSIVAMGALWASVCLMACSAPIYVAAEVATIVGARVTGSGASPTPSAEDPHTQQVIAQAKTAADQYAKQQSAYDKSETQRAIAQVKAGATPDSEDMNAVDWSEVANASVAINRARIANFSEKDRKAEAKAEIPVMRKRYPEVRGMTADEFTAMITGSLINQLNSPIFSQGEINGNELALYTPFPGIEDDFALGQDALYDQINDEFVAWCGCDGRTDIVVDHFGYTTWVTRIEIGEDGKSVASGRWLPH